MKFSLPVALAVLGLAHAAPAATPPTNILPQISRFSPDRARQGNSHREDSSTHPPIPLLHPHPH